MGYKQIFDLCVTFVDIVYPLMHGEGMKYERGNMYDREGAHTPLHEIF